MDSVRALVAGLVDYAGLFPPSELGMRAAVESYAGYFNGPDSASLGKFIVTADRLDELEIAAGDLLPTEAGSNAWRISVLVNGDPNSAADRILKFNTRHADGSTTGLATVDTVEMKTSSPDEIAAVRKAFPPMVDIYLEFPLDGELDRSVSEAKKARVRAKIRTGGVTGSAFPTTGRVVRFLRACCDAGLAFKATAGLHHPVRAAYRLTYEPDSASATMFGFVNVFLAAGFMWNGADDATVARVLEEEDASNFTFTDEGVSWRNRSLSANRIAETRRSFAISFGSCSFREPVDELKLLTSGVSPA